VRTTLEADLARAAAVIEDATSLALACHQAPDGDALDPTKAGQQPLGDPLADGFDQVQRRALHDALDGT
jgi:hypothetical protein